MIDKLEHRDPQVGQSISNWLGCGVEPNKTLDCFLKRRPPRIEDSTTSLSEGLLRALVREECTSKGHDKREPRNDDRSKIHESSASYLSGVPRRAQIIKQISLVLTFLRSVVVGIATIGLSAQFFGTEDREHLSGQCLAAGSNGLGV